MYGVYHAYQYCDNPTKSKTIDYRNDLVALFMSEGIAKDFANKNSESHIYRTVIANDNVIYLCCGKLFVGKVDENINDTKLWTKEMWWKWKNLISMDTLVGGNLNKILSEYERTAIRFSKEFF